MSYLLNKAIKAIEVTPSDSENLSIGGKRGAGIFVGGTGNISVEFSDGTQSTITSVAANTELPFRAVKVLSTGTTATNILALE